MNPENIVHLGTFSTSSFSADLAFSSDDISQPSEWTLAGWIYSPTTGPSIHLVDFSFSPLESSPGGDGCSTTISLSSDQVAHLPLVNAKLYSERTTLAYQIDAKGPGGASWRVAYGDFVITL